MTEFIFDFETCGNDAYTAVPVCVAFMTFERGRFTSDPYTFEELLDSVKFVKFDIEDMKKHGYWLSKDSVEWWSKQPKEVRAQMIPNGSEVTFGRFIIEFAEYLDSIVPKIDRWWSRGNAYDPVVLELMKKKHTFAVDCEKIDKKLKYFTIRDIRTWIDAKLEGTNTRDDFNLPEWVDKFIPHLCTHDIVVDVLRMQAIAQSENEE